MASTVLTRRNASSGTDRTRMRESSSVGLRDSRSGVRSLHNRLCRLRRRDGAAGDTAVNSRGRESGVRGIGLEHQTVRRCGGRGDCYGRADDRCGGCDSHDRWVGGALFKGVRFADDVWCCCFLAGFDRFEACALGAGCEGLVALAARRGGGEPSRELDALGSEGAPWVWSWLAGWDCAAGLDGCVYDGLGVRVASVGARYGVEAGRGRGARGDGVEVGACRDCHGGRGWDGVGRVDGARVGGSDGRGRSSDIVSQGWEDGDRGLGAAV